jgi:sugar-specific transcriptional regulator TrmB
MSIPEKYVEILSELGLTHTESKVYVALLCLKSATARSLHKEANIARQDVYRILSDLEEKGLIEKIIAKPMKFQPMPAKDAISILFQKRNQQDRQLRKKAKQTFRNFKDTCTKTPSLSEAAQFILLSKNEVDPAGHIDKLGKAVDIAKKNVYGLITFQLFMKVKLMDEHIWKRAAKRGVKLKFIIGGKANEQAELNLDPALKNNDNFEVKWTSTLPKASVLLVDEKEAFCRIGTNIDNPVLWSADPNFVAIITDYLKTKWKSLSHPRKPQIVFEMH